jgi:hypothetical protein
MVDYLKAYVRDGEFDLPRLINDDHFSAIKLLFNSGHYVSAAKLLMSFLDTIAFIEMGDVKGNFVLWLRTYADLTLLGIIAEELWELRNGLLHMTNLNSRSVQAGKVPRLFFYVGPLNSLQSSTPGEKCFNLKQLIDVVAKALSKWTATYNSDRSKLLDFVSRYDLTISDSRLTFLNLESKEACATV